MMEIILEIMGNRMAALEDAMATMRRGNLDDSPAMQLLMKEKSEWQNAIDLLKTKNL